MRSRLGVLACLSRHLEKWVLNWVMGQLSGVWKCLVRIVLGTNCFGTIILEAPPGTLGDLRSFHHTERYEVVSRHRVTRDSVALVFSYLSRYIGEEQHKFNVLLSYSVRHSTGCALTKE